MEDVLEEYGFKKDGLYTWINSPYQVMIYYDGITISLIKDDGDGVNLYEGITPKQLKDKMDLIEVHTKLKKVNENVNEILISTLSDRIFTNTSLYVSNAIINYIKYNNTTEDKLCDDLGIGKDKLKLYLSGSYNFSLGELARISVLINKPIIVK